MANSLVGKTLDSIEFARQSRKLTGVIAISALARLHDQIVDRDGEFSVSLRGECDDGKRTWLILDVEGRLILQCQRCLAGVGFAVNLTSRLELIADGQPWPDDELNEDDWDAIAADPALDIASLVEDEVILALPLAPVHEDCVPPVADGNRLESSPFAALNVLKKH